LPNYDHRRDLADKLINKIPENACVLAYNMSFEKRILADLATWFPEYAEKIGAITDNMRDLMVPFRKRDCYLWQMNGSYSIKAVLPALIPGQSYDGMEICNGSMAMGAYQIMCETEDPKELKSIRKALLEYCRLDTLAMVSILEKLREISKSEIVK
jgi:hypothetical protein